MTTNPRKINPLLIIIIKSIILPFASRAAVRASRSPDTCGVSSARPCCRGNAPCWWTSDRAQTRRSCACPAGCPPRCNRGDWRPLPPRPIRPTGENAGWRRPLRTASAWQVAHDTIHRLVEYYTNTASIIHVSSFFFLLFPVIFLIFSFLSPFYFLFLFFYYYYYY